MGLLVGRYGSAREQIWVFSRQKEKIFLIVLYFKTFSYFCSPIQAAVQIGCKISGLS